ncbi:MAG: NAD(P)H-dependent oxidoreductase [Candidatus Omnitrophota bacterium]
MNHLVIYSHPYQESFNYGIKETYVAELERAGHDVRIRDLYAEGFDPVLSARDLEMAQHGEYADDVKAEQDHVRWADVLTMICPIWWGGLTSNLRGYIDRVFNSGFAYAYTAGGLQKLLTGKQCVLINTMGAPYEVYEKMGMIKSMTQTIDECMSDFCGIEVVEHFYFGNVGGCTQEDREQMLEKVRSLAKGFGIENE